MTFTSMQDYRDALDAGHVIQRHYYGAGPSSTAAPAWHSGWYIASLEPVTGGDPAGASGTPGAGGTAYDQTPGGILFPSISGKEKRLIGMSARHADNSALCVKLVDRLVAVGSISITSTGDKDVNSVALPRYTSGEGVEVFFEIQTAGTTTIPVVSLASYTNQAGTSGRVGDSAVTFHSATAPKGGLQGPVPLRVGDYGVRSVEAINVATAGGGSCAINVLLVKTICMIGSMEWADRTPPAIFSAPVGFTHAPRIYDGATLMWMRKGSSSGTVVDGDVRVVWG